MGLFDTIITTITDFGSILGDTVLSLVAMIMYPILILSDTALSVLENIFNALYSFLAMILSIFDFLMGTVVYVFTALFPSAISVILVTLIVLVVGLALLRRFGGVSIAGFSLGGGGR